MNRIFQALQTGVARVVRNSPVLYIAVMGPTGSGKSTFINLVSGSSLRVGTGLQSETASVALSAPVKLGSQRVVLIDTPGFDDTIRSDRDVLTTIAKHLADMHRKGIEIHGVIYLHRITDNRVGGTALRNFRMFGALCGPYAMKNTAIVLNMWDQVEPHIGEAREKELCSSEIFFKSAVHAGACVLHHESRLETAYQVIDYLTKCAPEPLQIQTEMVEEGKPIHETAAGIALLGDLARKEQKHLADLRRLREELEEVRARKDRDEERELEDEEERVRKQALRVVEEQRRLQDTETAIDPSSNEVGQGRLHRALTLGRMRFRLPLRRSST